MRLPALPLLCALLVPGCSDAPEAPLSVLLVSVDTLRADHVLQGVGTPALDGLAARGVAFTLAFSASPSTAPSHASLLTGLLPGAHTVGTLNGQHALHPSHQTLAEVLAATGRRTGAIVSNPVLAAELGLDQGFGTYDDDFERREPNRDKGERSSDRAVDLAIEWLERDRSQPFFLWLHLQDPHGPYLPPESWPCGRAPDQIEDQELPLGSDHSGHRALPAYQVVGDERRVSEYTHRYACEVRHLDHQLGRLLHHLEARGLHERTLVVLTADHGEAFGEDDFWFAHGHSVGLEQVRVPLLLAGPGVPRGKVVDVPVSNVAIYATLLGALGLFPPEPVVGPSLLEVVRDPGRAAPVYVESVNQVGVAAGNAYFRRDLRPSEDRRFWSQPNPNSGGFWKPLGAELRVGLDVLRPDPDDKEQVARRLQTLLDRFVEVQHAAALALEALRQPVPVTEGARDDLQALGYLR